MVLLHAVIFAPNTNSTMSGKLPAARGPPKILVERKKRSCGECRRRKQKCDQKQPCRHCARRMPQPVCQYENSPYVPPASNQGIGIPRRNLVPGLSFADRRRNGRRMIPAQVPDFTGLTNSTQTSLPSTSYIPPPLLASAPHDPWHRSSVSSSISGSSAGETSWDPALYPQYPEPYPPGLLVDNTSIAAEPGPYFSNTFLPFTTESPVVSKPSFFIETCMLSTETITDRETTLAARYHAVSALQERLNNPALSTLDETIAQAVKLASNDLCYGETQDLRVHIHGIQQMTRLRGGLQSLGMNGTLAKMVIITDKIISIALELPALYSPSEITPYLPRFLPSTTSAPTNSSPATTTTTLPEGLDEATSALLKDITFLIDTVLALPASPSEWELSKVVTMSNWVYGRLHTPFSPTSTSSVSSNTSSAMHQSIRLAALVYCKAIQARKPLGQVVSEQDAVEIVDAVWKVPLEVWNGTWSTSDGQVGRGQGQGKGKGQGQGQGSGQGQGLLGTLVWTLAGILPVAKRMEGAYTTKTMMMAAAVQEAMRRSDPLEEENTNGLGVIGVLERIGRLQRWLEGGQGMMLQASSNSGPSKRGGSGSPGLGGQA